MIISASRRTDIPAYYSEWFIKRVRSGFFIRINPFNSTQRKVISLGRSDVDAFIFWSKNPQPLLKHLPLLDEKGYPYYFLLTLNDYPKIFEPRVPDLEERLDTFRLLSALIGPSRVIWRYDPIIISDRTPVAYHLETFERLAGYLTGRTQRVVISFFDNYPKVTRRLVGLDLQNQLQIIEPRGETTDDLASQLVAGLSAVAKEKQIAVFSCAEQEDWSACGVRHGSCIDGVLINQLFGLQLATKKDPGQRDECGCISSIDMGVYNTCPFLCRYCYANSNDAQIMRAVRNHNPDSPTLVD